MKKFGIYLSLIFSVILLLQNFAFADWIVFDKQTRVISHVNSESAKDNYVVGLQETVQVPDGTNVSPDGATYKLDVDNKTLVKATDQEIEQTAANNPAEKKKKAFLEALNDIINDPNQDEKLKSLCSALKDFIN